MTWTRFSARTAPHAQRILRSLQHPPAAPDPQPATTDGRTHIAPAGDNIRVRRRDRLDGLIHEYSQVA